MSKLLITSVLLFFGISACSSEEHAEEMRTEGSNAKSEADLESENRTPAKHTDQLSTETDTVKENDKTEGDAPLESEGDENNPVRIVLPNKMQAVLSATLTGSISGYAANPDNLDEAVTVRFYLDGEAGVGTFVGTVTAGEKGYDAGIPGSHAFNFQLADQYRDGAKHNLHSVMVVDGEEQPFKNPIREITVFGYNPAARQYYENTVEPLLQSSCGNCHDNSYESRWAGLVNPTPLEGTTALTNRLVVKGSGGGRHGGGNRCGTINSSPCKEIQIWWNMEFN